MHEIFGVAQLGEPRTRQRHLDDLLDPSRPVGHHRDAVGEEDRLIEAVGDEHNGLLVPVPDAQQLALEDLPGLRI
ncbi:hypothetical protein ACFSVK_20645 [Azorhizophilus paspali]|uniref:hypothetical protein n=1 Tax=Azorhizophilus paspali TaxID=69963 RepID=UPI003631709D